MGIQNFKFMTDFMNNLENPIIYVAKKNKKIMSSVANYENLKFDFNLNAFQTVTFDLYEMVDDKIQDCYQYFEEDMLLLVVGVCWYKIHVDETMDITGRKKSISGSSLECTLCSKRLIDFECNTGEILYDDYEKTIFYDATNPKGSLLHRVLNVCPNWSIGHVDDSLAKMQRSFDVDDNDVYSFLTSEVSEAFNCLFIFDTFNCTVNAYDLDTYGKNTNIFVSIENLAQNMEKSIDENSIFTCYRVNGGDGVYINEVNPNGTNKIYNFEYYLPGMDETLQDRINLYNEKYQELKPQYESIMLDMQSEIDIIQELYTRLPDDLESTDWRKYGLTMLDIRKKSFENQDTIYKSMCYDEPESFAYNRYIENKKLLDSVTSEYNIRKSQIETENRKYSDIKERRDLLQAELDMDNWFTEDEWKELDAYVVEETYTNDNYIVTDLEDDSERFNIERQLYDVAWKDLSKKCRPQYQYSSTLYNILTIPEFKDFLQYFELGNFIFMQTDYDTLIKLRIIQFSVDFSNTETINVTFSDAIRVKDIYDDAASIQAQANSAAMSFQFNKDQYDKSVSSSNFIEQIRKYGLDVATTSIQNASDQSQVWDESGMTFKHWNNEKQDFDPEQIKIINNLIVFSDSGFQDSKCALGKIPLDNNGNYAYGVCINELVSVNLMGVSLC